MHFLRRRDILRGLQLGAGALFLAPLCRNLVGEAQGAPLARKRLIVFTDGNGWATQGMPTNGTLRTTVRSETDWDVPAALATLAPHRADLSVVLPLRNPHGRNLHGNSWATLSVVPNTLKGRVGGISFDRAMGQQLGREDVFTSIVLGLAEFGRSEGAVVHTSADGPERPVSAPNSPVRAYAQYIAGRPVTELAADPRQVLAQDKSLLDAVCNDVSAARGRLAGFERQKFDQLLESCRALELQLVRRQALTESNSVPTPPSATLTKTGLTPETVRGNTDVLFQALAFGVSRVAHLSILGRDAHNDGWGFLGVGGDGHENLAHMDMGPNWTKPQIIEGYTKVTDFKAAELAHLWTRLKSVPEGDGTMADHTVVLWINSGGGKHHDGTDDMGVVMLSGSKLTLPRGRYVTLPAKRAISDLFVSVAQALDVGMTTFGDPNICKGGLF